jgi:hypothetical protein
MAISFGASYDLNWRAANFPPGRILAPRFKVANLVVLCGLPLFRRAVVWRQDLKAQTWLRSAGCDSSAGQCLGLRFKSSSQNPDRALRAATLPRGRRRRRLRREAAQRKFLSFASQSCSSFDPPKLSLSLHLSADFETTMPVFAPGIVEFFTFQSREVPDLKMALYPIRGRAGVITNSAAVTAIANYLRTLEEENLLSWTATTGQAATLEFRHLTVLGEATVPVLQQTPMRDTDSLVNDFFSYFPLHEALIVSAKYIESTNCNVTKLQTTFVLNLSLYHRLAFNKQGFELCDLIAFRVRSPWSDDEKFQKEYSSITGFPYPPLEDENGEEDADLSNTEDYNLSATQDGMPQIGRLSLESTNVPETVDEEENDGVPSPPPIPPLPPRLPADADGYSAGEESSDEDEKAPVKKLSEDLSWLD